MHTSRRLALHTACALGALATLPLWSAPAQAQAYPSKPITLICPWPAGGSTDRHLRGLAEAAAKHLGQNIVVENRPGGGGTTGVAQMALNARPDGYTVSQFPMGMLRIPHMQKSNWNPLTDFTYVIGVTGYTFGVTVRADSPHKTFNELVEAARKAPGTISVGNTGTGTTPHLNMEEVGFNGKANFNHVPFKGNADLTQALLGGHVMAQSDATGWDKFVDGGQMRLLVTFGEQRTKRWPNVPTAKELGYGVVSTSPYGIVGPKGMDPAHVKVLHDAFRKAMDDPKYKELMVQLNQEDWYLNTEDYTKWALETFSKEKALIDRLGLGAKN